jgi:hypothetical protein
MAGLDAADAAGCSLALITACPALSSNLLACLRLIGWKNIRVQVGILLLNLIDGILRIQAVIYGINGPRAV